ncbi:DNA polymerase III subunit theta [Klebsiella pneumoniae]|uniref:DNA polymerase III subunit theta n=1 Tax=Klebsiella pneumoniae TaxID=573 RepID=UPI0034D3B817
MSKWNIAAKSKDEQDKVNVDLAASGVAYKERLNMPVVAEVVAREQPEHLKDYTARLVDKKWLRLRARRPHA